MASFRAVRRNRSDPGYAGIVTTPPDEPVRYTEIRALPFERPGAEVLHDPVERAREPGDLALAHPLDPELLHQLLHRRVETPAR